MTAERCYLTTDYDEPAGAAPPALLTSGQDRTLRVADQFLRGVAIIGRAMGSPAVLGLKVEPGDGPVRIRLHLQWDRHTFGLWDRFTGKDIPREAASHPRLILIRAQHELRQAVLLTEPRGKRLLRATAAFDVPAEEIPRDGMLLLELWGAAEWPVPLPSGLVPPLAPNATSGLSFNQIEIAQCKRSPEEEVGGNGRASEREAMVSLGGLGRNELDNPGPRRLRSPLVVVNPNERGLRLRLKRAGGSAATRDPSLRRLGTAAVDRLRLRSAAAADATCEAELPVGFHLGSGTASRLRCERRPAGWDIVVPAAEEPTLVVLPDHGPAHGLYKLVSCVPEPRIVRPRRPDPDELTSDELTSDKPAGRSGEPAERSGD